MINNESEKEEITHSHLGHGESIMNHIKDDEYRNINDTQEDL